MHPLRHYDQGGDRASKVACNVHSFEGFSSLQCHLLHFFVRIRSVILLE